MVSTDAGRGGFAALCQVIHSSDEKERIQARTLGNHRLHLSLWNTDHIFAVQLKTFSASSDKHSALFR